MNVFSQNMGYNTLVRTLGNGANTLLEWLLKTWKKRQHTLNEVEMPELIWLTIE